MSVDLEKLAEQEYKYGFADGCGAGDSSKGS